jgi:hypothetical protein
MQSAKASTAIRFVIGLLLYAVSILACAVLLRQTERASQVRGATKDGP